MKAKFRRITAGMKTETFLSALICLFGSAQNHWMPEVFVHNQRKLIKVTAAVVVLAFFNAQAAVAQSVKDKLFADPTNIEINLAYLQEQLSGGNYKGAAATLQRVLLLDPKSKLAKVLYAEVQLRLGNLADARLILKGLLADKSLGADMRARAQDLSDKLEASVQRLSFFGSMGLAGGSADNALAAPKGPKVQYFNDLYDNNSDEVVEPFVDFDAIMSMAYKVPTYRERGLTTAIGFAGRDYLEVNMADSTTGFVSLGYSEKRKIPWSLNYSAFVTDVSGENYNAGQQIILGLSGNLDARTSLSLSMRGGETRHFEYQDSSVSKSRDNEFGGLTLTLARPITALPLPFLLTVTLGGDRSSAEEKHFSTRSASVSTGIRTRLRAVDLSVTADFLATEFDAADPLIGTDIREDERSRMSVSLTHDLPPEWGGMQVSLGGFLADTRSNIPNFTKTLSEVKLGLRKSF